MYRSKNAVNAQEWLLKQRKQGDYFVGYSDGYYTVTKSDGRKPSNKIISIEEITPEEDDYVYDIETEDGTFQAGVGSLILKNTDSIYTEFTLPDQDKIPEDEKVKRIYEVSTECAKRISDTFTKPIELEMENLKYPLILFSKKRYIYRCMEKNKKGDIVDKGIDIKGYQTVRRDNCKLVKKICGPVIDKIIYEKDIEGAKKMTRSYIEELLNGNFNIEDLVITKSLKSEYKEFNKAGNKISKPVQWHLTQKIRDRDPGSEPKPGERVPYVFIENNDKNALQQDRIEHPDFVIQNPKKCKIDVLYYLDRQIISPFETLFSVLIKQKDGTLYPLKIDNKGNAKLSKEYKQEIARQIWTDLRRKKENSNKGQMQISDFFSKQPLKIEELEEFCSSDEEIILD